MFLGIAGEIADDDGDHNYSLDFVHCPELD
jgi:hypothetical protein